MRQQPTRPGIITGAIVGALLTAPLIALFFLGDRLAGLPFIPFDVFDYIGRILPGDIITAGIDAMVDTIIAFNLGETSSTAKTIEQLMGLGMVLGIGIVVAAALYAALAALKVDNYRLFAGAVVGVALGAVMTSISNQVNLTATTGFATNVIWIVGTFALWGVTLGWVYNDLTTTTKAGEEATAGTMGRRDFLSRLAGSAAILTVMGAGLGALLNQRDDEVLTTSISTDSSSTANTADGTTQVANLPSDLPNAGAAPEPAPGTRLEYTPLEDHYRIDISSRPPVIEETEWMLQVSGLVAAPLAYTLSDLANNYEPVDQYVTMSCISNRIAGDLISTTRWTGLQLNRLIEEWELAPEAAYLKITSADNFDEFVSLDLIRNDDRIMLAYAWDGQPLTRAHGFPLRIYIPDHYGMKMPKWITDIEVVDEWGEGYWVRRGWSATAIVRTTSVIDHVAVEAAYEEDGVTYVPIGGIAYSGAKGISRVEVEVDSSGEWIEAELREPISETTWVIWRYDWPFEAGRHTFRVRTYDGNGDLQIEEQNGTRPDGATGIHRVSVEVPENILEQA